MGVYMSRTLPVLVGLVSVLAVGPALAGQGKAGLWNVTSTTSMAMTMPPEVAAQMKGMNMAMPTRTHTSQMCMSQAEVDSGAPPHIDQQATGCVTKVTSASAAGMTAVMTCTGRLKGTGQVKVSYSGAEHYTGSYSFKGTAEGAPTTMNTTFKGDWVKADCGAIKPYSLRTH